MESVQGNKFGPCPLRQLSSREDLLQETPLLKSDFYAIPSCNKRWLEDQTKQAKRNENLR